VKDKVRWGVIGCARIATTQVIPAMLQAEEAELKAIASRSLEKAEATAQQFSIERAYGSYEALLADPQIEAVYIPLPNHLHKSWSIKALRAGKHVLCEKPIALNAIEAREMQSVAQEASRLLLEAFMYRFSPIVQKILEIVRAGVLGEVRSMHASFRFLIPDDPKNVRLQAETGGGSLYDVGCYSINLLRMVAGREPLSASAKLSGTGKYGVDLGIVGLLDFGDSLLGTFDAGFDASGATYCRIIGTKGVLEAPVGFLGRGNESWLVLTLADRIERIVLPIIDPYMLEVQDMCEAIRGEHSPLFAWEPLDANMRVIDACYASDKSGCVVKV